MSGTYLAVDFGAGSGRVIAGTLRNGKLQIDEVHRFANRQIKIGKRLYWDFPALFQEMVDGLRAAADKGYKVKSIGIDTWGVDFGFIDKNGNLMGNPVCYRDERTKGLPDEFLTTPVERSSHYATTGTQVMEINTLFQLISMKKEGDPQLATANRLLFMPDLFSYFLTGNANNEYSIASTSELLDARERNWSWDIIDKASLSRELFGEIIMPGTVRGKLKSDIAAATGLGKVAVIAVCSHDTASAVYALPCNEKNCAFLSSGTWSLLGTLTDEPILSEEARTSGFTNEGSAEGKIRFLQNITGLWILQRLIAEWTKRGEECSYDAMIAEATTSDIESIIPVDDPIFANPASMEQTIQDYCSRNNMPVPHTKGEFMRCITQSLAQRYRTAIEQMNRLTPAPIEKLYIMGGGCRNTLLNQLTANATGLPVSAGPVEATAIGNILMQAQTMGDIKDSAQIKEIMTRSFEPKLFLPK
ncbi:MAG: rhamnulokinase [Bacteroidaceae bacterium]|nr:rhamnulokinase [Bacteroidaceae bacterium]